jgi:hypothetical protein
MATVRLSALVFVLALASQIVGQTLVVNRTVPNPITNFDISWIDITGRGTGPMLFQMIIAPGGVAPGDSFQIECVVTCTTVVASGLLYQARSGRFVIPAQGISLSSNEFFTDRGAASPSLNTTVARLPAGELRRVLLTTGQVPAGRVTMVFMLMRKNATGGPYVQIGQQTVYFDIVAIRQVTLVTPGIDASSAGADIPETYTSVPQFVWSSDLLPIAYPPGTAKFVISVYENPDNRLALSSVAESRPLWRDTVEGSQSVNYAQYPVSGCRALEPGRIYYWQVKAVLIGPVNGEKASTLYAFRVGQTDVAATLSPRQREMLRYLSMILGSNYGYALAGLRGATIQEQVALNGSTIDLVALGRLAEEFAAGKWTVKNATIQK